MAFRKVKTGPRDRSFRVYYFVIPFEGAARAFPFSIGGFDGDRNVAAPWTRSEDAYGRHPPWRRHGLSQFQKERGQARNGEYRLAHKNLCESAFKTSQVMLSGINLDGPENGARYRVRTCDLKYPPDNRLFIREIRLCE